MQDVFPDLYRAVEPNDSGDTSYEFVTEGKLGNWLQVKQFFESLARLQPPNFSATGLRHSLAGLDDVAILKFGGSKGDFWKCRHTQRGIFERIVDYLHLTPTASNDSIQNVQRKVWHLLARFQFNGGISEEQLKRNLEAALLAVVEHREKIEQGLLSLVGWMIERSRGNNAKVTPDQLLDAQGLGKVLSVSRWAILHERCRRQVQRHIELLGYRSEWDVRWQQNRALSCTTSTAPFVAVIGESGHGKSWRLCSETCHTSTPAVAFVHSQGDAGRDLQRAADEVWQNVLGHDQTIPLSNIALRQADVLGRPLKSPWLRIFLEHLRDPVEARALLTVPLDDWGVQLVVECDSNSAAVFEESERKQPDRVLVQRVTRFTPSERDEYLRRRIGEHWVDLPSDVREWLLTPHLANMYCDLTDQSQGWQPRAEYELMEKYWSRIIGAENVDHPQDELRLRRLAEKLLHNCSYPWDHDQLESAGIDDAAALRLRNLGWLRVDTDHRYAIAHERLLNFAVAKALAVQHRNGALEDNVIAELLGRLLDGEVRYGGTSLGYVPMDWFYLRSNDDPAGTSRVLALLEDRLHHEGRQILYQDLLPTLEAAAVPLLYERLVALSMASQSWEMESAIAGLATRPMDELRDRILRLLSDPRPRVQRAGVRLLALRPFPEALHKAWQLHIRMQNEPWSFFGEDPPGDAVQKSFLYDESFSALKACVRLAPGWIAEALKRASPSSEPIHILAYLAANLDDSGETWRRCKAEFFAKTRADKLRALALNVGTWRDRQEIEWLESSVEVEEDLLGAAAMQALAEIDPLRAASALRRLPEMHLLGCRNWFFPRLFLTVAEQIRDQLYQIISDAADPLREIVLYQGYENEMDARTVDFILSTLDRTLARTHEEAANADPKCLRLYHSLDILSAIGRHELLGVFAKWSGTELERRLAHLLKDVIGPQHGSWLDNPDRDPALRLLLKFGGHEYRGVINAFLGSADRYGQLDAARAAIYDRDEFTIDKLREIATAEGLWEGHPVLQQQAIRVLAMHGDGDGVLEASFRLGLKMSANILNWAKLHLSASSETIDEALNIIRRGDTAHLSGALIGLGLLKHTSAVSEIVGVLGSSTNQEARLASIVALGFMGAGASPATSAIVSHLTDKTLRYQAIIALGRIGTPECYQQLLLELDRTWDTELATRLCHVSQVRDAAIEKIVNRLQSANLGYSFGQPNDAELFLRLSSNEVISEVLKRLPALASLVREEAFAQEDRLFIAGTKAIAIRALGGIDSDAGFLAAKRTLGDYRARDRQVYPPLLYRLNTESAREVFLDLAKAEKNVSVVWSMARMFRSQDTQWLCNHLSDACGSTRLGACRLAAIVAFEVPEVLELVIRLLDDPADDVRRAAEQALQLYQRQQRAMKLVENIEVLGSESIKQTWLLLDAALHVGDAGFKGAPWPVWANRLADLAEQRGHPAVGEFLTEQLKKQREKSTEDAKRAAAQQL